MKVKLGKYFLFLVLWLYMTNNAYAQTHNNLWTRATVGIKFNKKWEVDGELQHRRQNGFENKNLTDKQLLNSLRFWFYYKKNESLTLGFSPLAIFKHNKIIKQEVDEEATSTTEVRLAANAEFKTKLHKKTYLQSRTGVEYRIYKEYSNALRCRQRLQVIHHFSNQFSLIGGDEVLLNTFINNNKKLFDHNRLYLQGRYKVSHKLAIELGYMYVIRSDKVSSVFINENNFITNFSYQIF